MKNKSFIGIVIIIVILLIVLFILSLNNIKKIEFIPEPKIVSAEEIQAGIQNTKKLYICEKWDNPRHKCGKNRLKKIIDDQDIIAKFINIL